MNIYIDSENINSKMFENILTRYHNHSILTTKVFADWTESNSKSWVKYCKQTSQFIEMVQILKKAKKQSIDFAIIVDILNDVLNDKQTNNAINHIVIISSDMDYMQLVKMLKKHNINAEIVDPRLEHTNMVTSDEDENLKRDNIKHIDLLRNDYEIYEKTIDIDELASDMREKEVNAPKKIKRRKTKTNIIYDPVISETDIGSSNNSKKVSFLENSKNEKTEHCNKEIEKQRSTRGGRRKKQRQIEKEKYMYFLKCIEILKQSHVKLIYDEKLKRALIRLADNDHERSLFDYDDVDFSKYNEFVQLANNEPYKKKLWIIK